MEILKQKAPNVNLFVLAYFMVSASISIAQVKLEGTFCVDYDLNDVYRCLEFQGEGKFEYHTGSDLGDESYGMGQFSFDKDYLILDYNDTPPKEAGYFKYSYWESKSDSMEIVLRGRNLNKINIRNGNVLVLPENYILKMDGEGKLGFKIKKGAKANKLIVSSLGYKKLEIVLNHPYNYNIQAYLEKAYEGNPIKNQRDTLRIVEVGESFFKTKSKNDEIINWTKHE